MKDLLKPEEIIKWVEENALYVHPYNPTWQYKLKKWKAQLAKQDSDLRLTPEEIKKLYEKWENSPANSVPNFDVYLEEAQLAKQVCPECNGTGKPDREKIGKGLFELHKKWHGDNIYPGKTWETISEESREYYRQDADQIFDLIGKK